MILTSDWYRVNQVITFILDVLDSSVIDVIFIKTLLKDYPIICTKLLWFLTQQPIIVYVVGWNNCTMTIDHTVKDEAKGQQN